MQFVTLRKTQYLIDRLANNENPKVIEFGIGIGSSITESSVSLSQEVYRGSVIAKGKKLIDGTPYMHVAGFVPPDVGDIAITEVGLYDENGKLLYFALIDPPIVINKHSYTARIIHMMVVYDDEAAALIFESGLTSLVEHNQDPNAHPDIRQQLSNLESRLLPDDLYADIFAAMAGVPVANSLIVIEYDPASLQETNRAYWRPLKIRQTLSPYTMILMQNEYDLNQSRVYPVRHKVQTKYFVIERQTQMFDDYGMPTHIVFNLMTDPVVNLNSELRKIIAALGYPPVNFSMTVVYDNDTHLPQLITYTGDLHGTVSISYDANQMLNRIEVNLLNGQIAFSVDYNVTLGTDNNLSNVTVEISPVIVDLVKTDGCLTYGIGMLLNFLISEFGFWQRLGLKEYQYIAQLRDGDVIHTLIINGFEGEPTVYNYWAQDATNERLIRGYALSTEFTIGDITAVQRTHLLA